MTPPTAQFSFLSGRAGSGKSFLARQWADADPNAALCSTTGISAINISGTTINALLNYYDTAHLKQAYVSGALHQTLRRNQGRGIWWYILDEVSMFGAEALNCLVGALQDTMIRLTLVGDFAQLPPVHEQYAFLATVWPEMAATRMQLDDIYRQTDREFVDALQWVRTGQAPQALEYFRPFLHPAPQLTFDGTTLKAKNAEVDTFNHHALERLQGGQVTFVNTRTGQCRPEWRYIPTHLHLKIGALVMILANKRSGVGTDFAYVNGDLGHLVDAERETAHVELVRSREVVPVTPVSRSNGSGDPSHSDRAARGQITYMPLRAAWASTVHKAQGLSLDRVQVDLRDRFFTQPSMLYVALSRVRTPEGLRLVGTPEQFMKRVKVDPRVLPWL